jgi:hypothetical protein
LNKIKYLYGSPLKYKDLKRADIQNALSIIILADKNNQNYIEEDKVNIMNY